MAAKKKKTSRRTGPRSSVTKSSAAAAKRPAKKSARKVPVKKTGAEKKGAPKIRAKKAAPRKAAAKKSAVSVKKVGNKRTTPGRKADTTYSAPATPGGSQAEKAVIVTGFTDKYLLLEEALQRADFWFVLEEARLQANVEAGAFRVLIKPDFNAFELHGSTATDPQLVEHLIDLLHDRGFTQVVVAEGRNSFDLWLENRDVQILADLLGYRYVTAAGREYDIVDLGEDLVAGAFGEGSVLHDSSLSRSWVDAHFRIVFAKNKTDDENAYTLCLDNLISILPLRDKDYHYRHRLKQEDVTLELLRHSRTDFCLIDAYVSNHGNGGSHAARPIRTGTLIAGHNLLLTDQAAALKMGLDPGASLLHAKAVRETGLPEPHRIDGELSTYPDWINVHPLILDSVRQRQTWPELSQILQPWIQVVDHESFPFKDPVNEQINRFLGRYLAGIDENPTVFWSVVAVNYFLAFVYRELQTVQTLYWKDHLWHEEVPLNLEPEAYAPADYEAIEDYLAPLERRTHALPADSNGLRWTFHEDGSVLFEFSRIIPADYHDFVSRVDISKSIQYMNDYIGGVIVPVKRNRQGLVTHQLERNLYLPQPNYLVLYQGKEIDVSKLEYIRYTEVEQKMFWKTMKSENDSAAFDDGSVRFSRLENGETRVSIFGRQQFTLPLFWQMVDLDNYPALKHALFEHAYTTFFSNTMANFEAVYEGREVRIGKAWNPRAGEADDETQAASPSEQIVSLLTQAQEFMQRNIPEKENVIARMFSAYSPTPERVDEDGFAHFQPGRAGEATQLGDQTDNTALQNLFTTGNSAARDFWKDLYQAIQKDWGVQHG